MFQRNSGFSDAELETPVETCHIRPWSRSGPNNRNVSIGRDRIVRSLGKIIVPAIGVFICLAAGFGWSQDRFRRLDSFFDYLGGDAIGYKENVPEAEFRMARVK